jgi:transcriptional regulator with XRE-family HTH domain
MNFAERLNSLMVLNNLSQNQLAKKSGITRSAICRYCNGNRVPSIDNLLKLSDALNVSADCLLGKESK